MATLFVGPCCLTGGASLRPLYDPGHQYSYDPATLGDMVGNLGRTFSETYYIGYGFVLVLLLRLARDMHHSAARRGRS